MIQIMARKNYSEEFRRQAVDLYESTPGATVRSIAADLGLERSTLRHWLDLHGTGKKTAADGTPAPSPLKARAASPSAGGASAPAGQAETMEARVARLEAENAALRIACTTLTTEREILRSAAKYFAGETNW